MFLVTAGSGLSLANLKLLLGHLGSGLACRLPCTGGHMPVHLSHLSLSRPRAEEMLTGLVVVRVLAAVQPPLRLTS